MSDIQIYLLEFDKNKKEASRIAEQSSTRTWNHSAPQKTSLKRGIGLQNNQLKLVELIESLGEYINNEEPTIRAKGMSY